MTPVIGYQGGKRRLLPRLRPHFPVESVEHYVEPFAGMGALYLDIRGRGYTGPAVLADSHPQVASFWRLLHDDPSALIAAMTDLGRAEATADRYYAILGERCDDPVAVTARFLWLTNYAFGNTPNVYRDGWSHTVGTKLTSAAKWGKTFPWQACVERAEKAARVVAGTPTVVCDDAAQALAIATADSHVYADPPYHQERRYAATSGVDHIATITAAPGLIVLSESYRVADRLHGWTADVGEVTARMSGGTGADGKRGEVVYLRFPNVANVAEGEVA